MPKLSAAQERKIAERKKVLAAKALKNAEAMRSLVRFREMFFADRSDVPPAPFHHQWSNILLTGKKHFVVEAFRESAKTQLVIRANLLHAIAFPSQRRQYIVMICSNKWMASNRLKEVSRLLRGDNSGLIGAVVEDWTVDSGDALEVKINKSYAEAVGVNSVRMETYGKGSAVRGLVWGARRPDLVIIDDPQDVNDSNSEIVTDADWEWFLSDVVFLGQSTRIFMIGNNLGERCIVERVIDQADQLGFDWMRIPVLDAQGRSNWPERFSAKEMEEEKNAYARMGKIDLWYRERMCKCISPDSQLFKRNTFKYYKPNELNMSDMSIYMTVDPAASESTAADRTAIVVVGVNLVGHWFVLDVWADRKKPSDVMDAIFAMVQKWRPLLVGIESAAFQAAFQDFLIKEMPRRNTFFTIEPLKAAKRKEIRIQTAIQPRLQAGTIWFPSNRMWVPDLEQELLNFPHSLHDDIADALAYVEQIACAVPVMQVGLKGEQFYEWA